MRKFMKHALDILLICLRVHHAVELLQDKLDDLF